MLADTHMHTRFSCDSRAELEEMCEAALARGLDVICFTEHLDHHPLDSCRGFFDFDSYSRAIDLARARYDGRLLILKGLEFSEPHLYPRELEYHSRLDYDFILGSIHWVQDKWIGDRDYQLSLPLEELFARHYRETRAACRLGGFDSLAHIDFPRRYLKAESVQSEILKEIMALLVSQDICLEINTSPLRKELAEAFPARTIMDWYLQAGGTWATTGSDAHNPQDVGYGLRGMSLEKGIQCCYYQRRKRRRYDPLISSCG